jgi:hypothetical protein
LAPNALKTGVKGVFLGQKTLRNDVSGCVRIVNSADCPARASATLRERMGPIGEFAAGYGWRDAHALAGPLGIRSLKQSP